VTFVFQTANKHLALNPVQQVGLVICIHQATQHLKLKTELQGSSFKFLSAIENEFNAFNLQLKARPRKLHLN